MRCFHFQWSSIRIFKGAPKFKLNIFRHIWVALIKHLKKERKIQSLKGDVIGRVGRSMGEYDPNILYKIIKKFKKYTF